MNGLEDSGINKIPVDAKVAERAEYRNSQIEEMEKMFPIDSVVNIWRESKKKLEGGWKVGKHYLEDETDKALITVFKTNEREGQESREIELKDLMEYNGIGEPN